MDQVRLVPNAKVRTVLAVKEPIFAAQLLRHAVKGLPEIRNRASAKPLLQDISALLLSTKNGSLDTGRPCRIF